jgi:transglutaminase-like putative cysteine protease
MTGTTITGAATTGTTITGAATDVAETAVRSSAPIGVDAATTTVRSDTVTSSTATGVTLRAQSVSLVVIAALPGVVLADVIDHRLSVIVAVLAAVFAGVAMSAADSFARTTRYSSRTSATSRIESRALVPTLVTIVGALVTAVVVSALVPGPGRSAGDAFGAAIESLVRGWSALVTSAVPADPEPLVLVPIAVGVWVSTCAAIRLLARAGTLTPLLPATVVFVLAWVAAGSHPFAPTACAAAYLLGCGVFLAVGRPGSEPSVGASAITSTVRSAATQTGATRGARQLSIFGFVPAVAVAVTAVVLGVVMAPLVMFGRDDEPFDARERWPVKIDASDAADPLDVVGDLRRDPERVMFTVRTTEPFPTRLVALDSFDGARWTTSAQYERTGTNVIPPERLDVARRAVRADVTLGELTGPWLPSFGDPIRLSGVSAALDASSGSFLLRSGDLADAAAPNEYRIDADVILPDLNELQFKSVGADAPIATVLPEGLPDPLQEMADEAMGGATSPLAQAVLLERYLRLSFSSDDTVVPGYSYGHLVDAFAVEGAAADEQFATAFAVLGRVVGLPTRVVVGFAPGTETSAGVFEVRAGDVRVWPEVDFDGVGWVAFDPAPRRDGGDGSEASSVGSAGQEIIVRQGDESATFDESLVPSATVPPLDGTDTSATSTSRNWFVVAAVMLAVVVAIVACAAAAVLIAKRRRTTRRRAASDPRTQVLGAWHDVLDRLLEYGVDRPRQHTVDELMAYPDATSAPLTGLYRPVNRALYSSAPPQPDDVAQAWRTRDRFVQKMSKDVGFAQRLRWSLDPRPLLASSNVRSESRS